MTADITGFGTTQDGRRVDAIRLRRGDLGVTLLTWGAVVQSVRLAGVPHDLTLGSDRLADYEGAMRYHGPVIGPVVNRLTGAAAEIAGVRHRFDVNMPGGHTLHSGSAGTHLKVWTLDHADETSAHLSVLLGDGEGGFPGNRRITARFTLTAPATLRLDLTATTDAPTLMNLANHSYWNLDGTETWAGHRLRIDAGHILPTTDDFRPTGEVRAVAGTPYDLRTETAIAPGAPELDTNFCVATARGPLHDRLWLRGASGVSMVVATTEPGMQVYDGRDARRPGQGPHEGLAVEAQFWPDAPSHAGFPPITLTPGDDWHQTTDWRFSPA